MIVKGTRNAVFTLIAEGEW